MLFGSSRAARLAEPEVEVRQRVRSCWRRFVVHAGGFVAHADVREMREREGKKEKEEREGTP